MAIKPPDHNKHQKPIVGGRYWDNNRWVNAEGESLDPDDIEREITEEMERLKAKLETAKAAKTGLVEAISDKK